MTDIAIRCEGLSKQYRIGEQERYKALRDVITDAAASPFRRLRSAFDRRPQTVDDHGDSSCSAGRPSSVPGQPSGIGRQSAVRRRLFNSQLASVPPNPPKATRTSRPRRLIARSEYRLSSRIDWPREDLSVGSIVGTKRAEIQNKFYVMRQRWSRRREDFWGSRKAWVLDSRTGREQALERDKDHWTIGFIVKSFRSFRNLLIGSGKFRVVARQEHDPAVIGNCAGKLRMLRYIKTEFKAQRQVLLHHFFVRHCLSPIPFCDVLTDAAGGSIPSFALRFRRRQETVDGNNGHYARFGHSVVVGGRPSSVIGQPSADGSSIGNSKSEIRGTGPIASSITFSLALLASWRLISEPKFSYVWTVGQPVEACVVLSAV